MNLDPSGMDRELYDELLADWEAGEELVAPLFSRVRKGPHNDVWMEDDRGRLRGNVSGAAFEAGRWVGHYLLAVHEADAERIKDFGERIRWALAWHFAFVEILRRLGPGPCDPGRRGLLF